MSLLQKAGEDAAQTVSAEADKIAGQVPADITLAGSQVKGAIDHFLAGLRALGVEALAAASGKKIVITTTISVEEK